MSGYTHNYPNQIELEKELTSAISCNLKKLLTDNNTTQTSYTFVKCNKYTGLECTGGYKVEYTPMVNGKDDVANRVTIESCMSVDMTNGQCLD